MKMEDIKTIVQLMSEHDLTEFSVEAEDMHLKICRSGSQPATVIQQHVQPTAPAMPQIQPVGVQPSADAAQQTADSSTDSLSKDSINSPIVGTFYRAPAPDADPFVKIGSRVEPDTVVCIVEAMKVMNEIKAEKNGVIKEILVENGQPVEYGQPLFVLE